LQLGEQQPSPIRRAVLIGAVDGFFFLGILGLVAGAVLGISGRRADELLLPMVLGAVLLIGGAIFLSTLAYAITYRTAECLYGFAGFFLGGFLASMLLGSGYGPVACVPGLCLGLLLCRAVRRDSPRFHAPNIGEALPPSHSNGSTDIIGPPHLPPGSDAIRKPGTDDEQ
jgi:hypothetical protein